MSTPAKQAIWTREYEVNTLLVNPQKRLGLVGLLNLLQDTAWHHARHLGHGYEAMIEQQLIWVLTRQKLVMREWPQWGDLVALRTWVRPIEGPFANRDFEIRVGDRVVGECTTSWLTMDLRTRRPKKVDLQSHDLPFRTDYRLGFDADKVALRTEGLETFAEFSVRNSDLDLNNHVNNTRYAQWILDSVPLEWHRVFKIHAYEVNFLAEVSMGDRISIQSAPVGMDGDVLKKRQFQGWRASDQKTVFSATIMGSELESQDSGGRAPAGH